MQRTKRYERAVFSPEIIREASGVMQEECKTKAVIRSMEISLPDGEEWGYDDEEEFFADYRNPFEEASFREFYIRSGKLSLHVHGEDSYRGAATRLTVEMERRGQIMRIFNIFDANVERCKLPEEETGEVVEPKIFIGHGHSSQWRELKDHLHDKHDFDIEAYEIGARAGLTVQEVLDKMLTSSSFALLVLTGEDEDTQGKMHARENVVHELGLFQGRLGRQRAIILLEEGVHEFSNIHGVNQIRFRKSGITEVYGDVLATIKREFR